MFRLTALPLLMACGYSAVVVALCRPSAVAFFGLLASYASSLTSVWLMVGLGMLFFRTIAVHRIDPSVASFDVARTYLQRRWVADRCYTVIAPLLTIVVLLGSYNLYKEDFLPGAGFWFGPEAVRIDQTLFGQDPWRVTHAWLSSPWETSLLDLAYHAWFVPMVVGVALCSFARPGSLLALRYLTSYVLLWIIQGSILAYLLPAAGPCFYHAFQPDPTHFDDLFRLLGNEDAYLRAHAWAGLYSQQYQHGLLALFRSPELVMGGGISAMPSLHNAMAVLFACAGWSVSRRAGSIASCYAAVIWIGSIDLGWHYALDGIVACATTIGTWVAASGVLKKYARRAADENHSPTPDFDGGMAVA